MSCVIVHAVEKEWTGASGFKVILTLNMLYFLLTALICAQFLPCCELPLASLLSGTCDPAGQKQADRWNGPCLWAIYFVHTHTCIGGMCECRCVNVSFSQQQQIWSVESDRTGDAVAACWCLCFHLWAEWRLYGQGSTRIYDQQSTNVPVFAYSFSTCAPSIFHCLLWFGPWTDSLEFAFKAAHVTHGSNCSKYILTLIIDYEGISVWIVQRVNGWLPYALLFCQLH